MIALPARARGRQSAAARQRYEAELEAFCAGILEIRSRLDFEVSSRGWAYILEEYGVDKGEFDAAERLIVACRKGGNLPFDICAEDNARAADNLLHIDRTTPKEEETEWIVGQISEEHLNYRPLSFWDDQDYYLEAVVEKIDSKSLFARDCARYFIPLTNARAWNDLNSRAAMMRRFAYLETRGKQCVLLYCGDHDPSGLVISEFLRSNMADLSQAVRWSPGSLIIDRFGLNFDLSKCKGLTWIDGLSTGNPRTTNLEDPQHPDHFKPYVQDYLRRFGPRKVEANALVVHPEAGRELCRQAILRYVPEDAPEAYEARLALEREKVRLEVIRFLAEGGAPSAPTCCTSSSTGGVLVAEGETLTLARKRRPGRTGRRPSELLEKSEPIAPPRIREMHRDGRAATALEIFEEQPNDYAARWPRHSETRPAGTDQP